MKKTSNRYLIIIFLITILFLSSFVALFNKIIQLYKTEDINLSTHSNNVKINDQIKYENNSEDENKFNDEKKSYFEDNLSSIIKNNFNNINGNYSFAFLDLNDFNLISINDQKSISASVIKIYIMINAFEQVKDGNIKLYNTYYLSQEDKVGGSGILNSEANGKALTYEELIKLMITKSDNTATNVLINRLGMDSINKSIKSLGCTDTQLNRLMMDENAIANGIDNYTSVNDLCLTFKKIYANECVDEKYDSIMLEILKDNTNDKKIPALLPSNIEVANKTGENIGIENDAGIIFSSKGAYILCFMTSNGSSDSQVSAISQSSKEIFDAFINYKS